MQEIKRPSKNVPIQAQNVSRYMVTTDFIRNEVTILEWRKTETAPPVTATGSKVSNTYIPDKYRKEFWKPRIFGAAYGSHNGILFTVLYAYLPTFDVSNKPKTINN